MEIWEEFRKYINEHAKELEDQIAAEEAAMTEEERAADKLRQERFAKKMMELAKKKLAEEEKNAQQYSQFDITFNISM